MNWFVAWDHRVFSSVGPKGSCHGPLARYVKLRVAQAPGMPGTFPRPPQVSDPDMHHGTCVTHVPWCMTELLTSGFLWNWWRGKRSRHSRRIRTRNSTYLVRGTFWHDHDDVIAWQSSLHHWSFVRETTSHRWILELHLSPADYTHKGPVMWTWR